MALTHNPFATALAVCCDPSFSKAAKQQAADDLLDHVKAGGDKIAQMSTGNIQRELSVAGKGRIITVDAQGNPVADAEPVRLLPIRVLDLDAPVIE